MCQKWFFRVVKGNVDFLTINRLAEWILRSNPLLAKALALTYKFVLVDEFQDTTYAQYDFLTTLLNRMHAEVTVVGDNKQRIMSWAGAKPDSFGAFIENFAAKKIELKMNYRSAPGLVQIHHTLARSIEQDYKPVSSAVKPKIISSIAEIWNFSNSTDEFAYLANWLKNDMQTRGLVPSDYGILVRQKPDETYSLLSNKFLEAGLFICNESQKFGKFSLQDISCDELFIFLRCLFRLAIHKGSSVAWTTAAECMEFFFPTDYENPKPRNHYLLDKLIQEQIRPKLGPFVKSEEIINDCLVSILLCIGEPTIRGAFPQHYSQVNLETFLNAVKEYLLLCAKQSTDWQEFINRVERINQIPMLTVHKSKGLEYDTVIFLGLDDNSWWSYSPRNPEGKATFFVGLSRAKQRVVFTYGRGALGRTKISELYGLLAAAGVPEITIP